MVKQHVRYCWVKGLLKYFLQVVFATKLLKSRTENHKRCQQNLKQALGNSVSNVASVFNVNDTT